MTAENTRHSPIPADLTKVNMDTSGERDYWTYKLNCTETELRDAIDSVGNDPGRITEYLHMVRGKRDEE